MPKSKFSAWLYLFLVFLSGALVGGLSYRLYSMNTVIAGNNGMPKASPEEFRRRYVESMRTKVGLDAQQVEQVNQILDETRAQYDQIRMKMRSDGEVIQNQQVAKMAAVLRDDQKAAFTEFRAEREKMRREMREKQPKKQ
jgi:uncharacterized protein YdiU (UPF0061 family)